MDNETEEEIHGSFRQWFKENRSLLVALTFLATGATLVIASQVGLLH